MGFRQPYPLDHASHIPILVGLARIAPLHKVFEAGAGVYSTGVFLNRNVFPEMQTVVSIEPDPVWRENVNREFRHDHRLTVYPSLEAWPDNTFDLFFIDNGPKEDKAELIRDVANSDFAGTVVIHDSEVAEYAAEIYRFKHSWFFHTFEPGTAVATNNDAGLCLATVAEVLRGHEHYPVDDVMAWKKIFEDRHV